MSKDLPDLLSLLDSWLVDLRGERKSPSTLRGYRAAVAGFLGFCAERGRPAELSRDNVVAYMARRAGAPSSARLQLTVLKLFAKWLAAQDETEFDAAPVVAVKMPKADQPAVPNLSDNELARLVKACEGRKPNDKRDKALVVLFAETGLRAAEMLALDVGDVDVIGCQAHVIRGRGGKTRRVRFSPGAAATLDRWLRARRSVVARPAERPLWIARGGERLSYTGLRYALSQRAAAAGVSGFHLHRLRHTAATRWLRAGGSETGLMTHAGWSSIAMVDRYAKAASEQLAAEEFDRLGLGVTEL